MTTARETDNNLDTSLPLACAGGQHDRSPRPRATPAALFGDEHGFIELTHGCWTNRTESCLQVFYVCEGDGTDYELFEVDEAGVAMHWLLTNGPQDRRDVWYEDGKMKNVAFTGAVFGGKLDLVAPRVELCPRCAIPVVDFDENIHSCDCIGLWRLQ